MLVAENNDIMYGITTYNSSASHSACFTALATVLKSERNFSDIENLLLSLTERLFQDDAKLHLNEKVLSQTEIYKTQSPL